MQSMCTSYHVCLYSLEINLPSICSPWQGYLSKSVMFYGYYNNTSCQLFSLTNRGVYSIPVAYFFTIAIAFFIICIILVYRLDNRFIYMHSCYLIPCAVCFTALLFSCSISKSFGKSCHSLTSNGNMAVKVFCSWDFKVTKKTSVRMQSEKISTQLKVRNHLNSLLHSLKHKTSGSV